jgi:hypothetical protein
VKRQKLVPIIALIFWCLYRRRSGFSVRWGPSLNKLGEMQASMPVPWLRRLSAGLSSRGPKFDPGSIRIRFLMDKLALPSFFSVCATSGFPCQVIPPVLRTHRLISTTVVRRTSGVKSGKIQTKLFCFGYQEVLERKVGLLSYFCQSECPTVGQAASRRPFTAKPHGSITGRSV